MTIMEWPPRNVIGLLALVFSVLGGMAMTLVLVWLAYLVVYGDWTAATEAARAAGVVQAMVIVAGGVVAVIIALGFAINRRKFEGELNRRGARMAAESGDPETPQAAAEQVADAAQAEADSIKRSDNG